MRKINFLQKIKIISNLLCNATNENTSIVCRGYRILHNKCNDDTSYNVLLVIINRVIGILHVSPNASSLDFVYWELPSDVTDDSIADIQENNAIITSLVFCRVI